PAGHHLVDVAVGDSLEVALGDLRRRGHRACGVYAPSPIVRAVSTKRELGRGERVLPGLWRLRLPLPWPGVPHGNAWAIAAGSGIVLVDTGTHEAGSLAQLERALDQVNLRLEHVRLLVCTHAHSDHWGQAAPSAACSSRATTCSAESHSFTTTGGRPIRSGSSCRRSTSCRGSMRGSPCPVTDGRSSTCPATSRRIARWSPSDWIGWSGRWRTA